MISNELTGWLQTQKQTLDLVLAKAGERYFEQNKGMVNFAYDLRKCQEESFLLKQRKDLCYDRLNTAFCYSLWYQPRRINTFLSHFDHALQSIEDEATSVYDLGAGTGAVQWAMGLVYHWLREQGRELPGLQIVNVDTSAMMLHYNEHFLWPAFCEYYPFCRDMDVRYSVNSWDAVSGLQSGRRWVTASYLFDMSDTTTGINAETDYESSLLNRFTQLLDSIKPSNILLLTSDQEHKRALIHRVSDAAKDQGYIPSTQNASDLLQGRLEKTSTFRQYIKESCNGPESIGKSVSWEDVSCSSVYLVRRQSEMNFGTALKSRNTGQVLLYTSPASSRKTVVLNDEQKRAARNSDRPTIINGSAGSGKSIVLTERIKNLVEASAYDPKLRVLLTTFNQGLRQQLWDWLREMLDDSKVESHMVGSEATFKFRGSSHENIRVMHFDTLPTRIGGRMYETVPDVPIYKRIIADCIKESDRSSNPGLFNEDYIWDEYYRVIYGLQVSDLNKYLKVERRGRPRLNSNRREKIWRIVEEFKQRKQTDSFYCRRNEFLMNLLEGRVLYPKFTHVFVDEYQDFTPADYQILYQLLENPDNLVIAGDASQAVQLGRFAEIPRSSAPGMARREIIHLRGSYRLPHRISECINPLSKSLSSSRVDEHEQKNTISPQKDAPPGARPIVVYAADDEDMSRKLGDVFRTYSPYGFDRVTILEQDDKLRNVLRFKDLHTKLGIDTDSVLRVKGLEKPCVIWSTRVDIENKGEINEYVYTILSRTCQILVIALFPNTLTKYYNAIGELRSDRLILWDAETEEIHNEICRRATEVVPFYEDTVVI